MPHERLAGSCHCGAIRFTAPVDLAATMTCNCSICRRTGAILTFVPRDQLEIESGMTAMTDYQFGKRVIHHLFCTTCGVRPFGHGVGPDGSELAAVNVRCLDGVDLDALRPMAVDGRSF